MTTYVSFSYSLSSVMFSYILAQMPRHSTQPVDQSNPTLRSKQRRVSHPILQLYRTTFSSAFGATSMTYCTGSSLPGSTAFQPRFCGCRCGPSLDTLPYLHLELVNSKHGGYGTWQLETSEEGFQAAQNVYWWLPSDESAAIYLVCHPLHLCTGTLVLLLLRLVCQRV